jgi:hypothetical protein
MSNNLTKEEVEQIKAEAEKYADEMFKHFDNKDSIYKKRWRSAKWHYIKIVTTERQRAKVLIDFKKVLEEKHQSQISTFYNYDKTDEEMKARRAVIKEYQYLIALFKQALNTYNKTT